MSRKAVLLILFAPFLLNLAASFFTHSLIPRNLWASNPEEAMKILYTYIWSYQSVFMVIIQVSFGIALLHKVELSYDLNWRRDIPLIAVLLLVAEAFFFAEHLLQPSYETEWFRDVVRRIPLWARYLNAFAAPFTAGIFEEVIWRGFGIESLMKFTTDKGAILIQALAFALWHISPIHVIFVFFIGLAYGFAYIRRKSLAPLIIAHVLTDLIGFSTFLLT